MTSISNHSSACEDSFCLSTGSTLFDKVPVYRFSVNNGLKRVQYMFVCVDVLLPVVMSEHFPVFLG